MQFSVRELLHPTLLFLHQNMAPSATETITLPSRTVEKSTVKLTSNTGPYKELAPIGYEKKAEEEGADGFLAAKVKLHPSLSVLYSLIAVSKLFATLGNRKIPST